MKHINRFTPVAVFAALAMIATPAFAQRHSSHDRGAQGNSGARTESRGGGSQNRGAARRAQPPTSVAPRVEQRQPVAPRVEQRQSVAPRLEQRVQPQGRAVPRAVVPRGVYPRYDGRIVTGRPYYVRPYYSRPFYSFRPRLSLGFGIWLGYPVEYPYAVYGYPYPAYPEGSVSIAPNTNYASGGVSFDISPATAQIYVDGEYIGIVSDFGPMMAPLGLTPGRHHIEIRESGFETMAFDADIVAGQVLPFQGTLQRF